jgi:anti-sigma B factor antagonist
VDCLVASSGISEIPRRRTLLLPTPTEVRDGLLAAVVTRTDSTYVVSLAGELDMANAGTLAVQLEQCEAGGADRIVLDLAALEFIDSTGITLLVGAHQRLNRNGSEAFQLIPSQALAVRRVIETTGLHEVLPFQDRDAACP